MVIPLVLLANQLTTAAMLGIIWFVQVVHYPLFARVGPAEFADYELSHQRRTTWVVMPLMLVEAGTALLLLIFGWSQFDRTLLILNVVLLAIIWLSTFFLQVPLHARLARRFDADPHRQLVRSNWLRTVAWTLRGLLVFILPYVTTSW